MASLDDSSAATWDHHALGPSGREPLQLQEWQVKLFAGSAGRFGLRSSFGTLRLLIAFAVMLFFHFLDFRNCLQAHKVSQSPKISGSIAFDCTWWLIPLSKWVTTMVINGISGGNVHL